MVNPAMDKQPAHLLTTLPVADYLIFLLQPGDEADIQETLQQLISNGSTITVVFMTDDEQHTASNIHQWGDIQSIAWPYSLNEEIAIQTLLDTVKTQLQRTPANIVISPSPWHQQEQAAQLCASLLEGLQQIETPAELWFHTIESHTPCNVCIEDERFYRLSAEQCRGSETTLPIPEPSSTYTDTMRAFQQQDYALISVIVRTQQRPHLLIRALQSLVVQSYPRLQAVVVNDGGDDIDEIIQRFQPLISEGVKYVRHTTAQGRTRAANAGIQAAEGEWLAFLDDDDTFEPNGLMQLARFIDWDKQVIYGQVHLLKMAGDNKDSQKIGLFAESYNPDTLLLNNYVPICAYICQRERVNEIQGFDEDFEFLEDWDFFYRLTRGQQVHYVAEPVSNYCVWGESYTTSKNTLKETENRERFFAKHLPHLTPSELQRASLAFVQLRDDKQNELNQSYQAIIEKSETHKQQIQQSLQQQTQTLQSLQQHNQNLTQNNQTLSAEALVWQERITVAHQKVQEHVHEIEKQHELRASQEKQLQSDYQQQLKNLQEEHQKHLKNLQAEHQKQLKTLQIEHATLMKKQAKDTKRLQEQLNGTALHIEHLNQHHQACIQEKQHFLVEAQQCQQNAENLNQQVEHLRHSQTFSTQRWTQRANDLLQRAALHLPFGQADSNVLNVQNYGWTPIIKGFSGHYNEVYELAPAYSDLEFPIPMMQHRVLRWILDWSKAIPINVLLFKMGTYLRQNQCHLELTLTPLEQENNTPIHAVMQGEDAKDHSFAAFNLSRPLKPGRYECQLQSPDTDNSEHLLGVWLTSNHKRRSGYVSPHYHYAAPQMETLLALQEKLSYTPLISVLIPTYNTPATYLRACLDSIINQLYTHWEICISDDASTQPQVKKILEEYRTQYPDKIKIHYGQENQHISGSSNAALELVEGEFVALLDHDDLLTKDALYEIVSSLNAAKDPDAVDVLYSDEDKWDEEKQVFDEPHFKPDWSPENLRGQMYIGHLGVYRTSRMREVGGFRLTVVGSQDWDLALRITELGGEVKHIPKVLYHWRKHSGSTAGDVGQKNYAVEAGLQVVRDALKRENQSGIADFAFSSSHILVRYPVPDDEQDLVSIIIPNKDQADLLKVCIDSVVQNNDYKHWEIIIVDNGSDTKATKKLYKKYAKYLGEEKFRVIWDIAPFNFSKMVNVGAQAAKGDFFLLLNNDTKVISPSNWLEEMVGYARREPIGGVGCKLLYPDNTLQHAGVVCGLGGVANHSHKFYPVESPGYIGRLNIVANYAGSTAACLMVRRDVWEALEGFDEKLQVAFNDVDFCLRILAAGYRHVVLPHVLFYHYESKSRGVEDNPVKQRRFAGEVELMEKRWKKTYIDHDPYYNSHLTKKRMDFSIDEESIYYCELDYEELPS